MPGAEAAWCHGVPESAALVDSDTLVFAAGSILQKLALNTSDLTALRKPARGASLVAACSTKGLIAYAEAGVDPKIFVDHAASGENTAIFSRDDSEFVAYQQLAISGDGEYVYTIDHAPTHLLTVWDVSKTSRDSIVVQTELPPGTYTLSVSPCDRNSLLVSSTELCIRVVIEACQSIVVASRRDILLPSMDQYSSAAFSKKTLGSVLHVSEYLSQAKDRSTQFHAWTLSGDAVLAFSNGYTALVPSDSLQAVHLTQCNFTNGVVGASAAGNCIVFAEAGQNSLHTLSMEDLSGPVRTLSIGFPVSAVHGLAGSAVAVVVTPSALCRIDVTSSTPELSQAVPYHAGPILSVGGFATEEAGTIVVSIGRGDGRLLFRDALTGHLRATAEVPTNITAHTLDARGGLALGTADGTVLFYDLSSAAAARLVFRGQIFTQPVTHLLFAGDSVVVALSGSRAVLLKIPRFSVIGYIDLPCVPTHATTANRGSQILLVSEDASGQQTIHTLHVPAGASLPNEAFGEKPLSILPQALQHKSTLAATPRISGVAALGGSVVFACEDMQLWQFAHDKLDGRPLGTFLSHRLQGPVALSVSPDEQTLASSGSDGGVFLRSTADLGKITLAGFSTGRASLVSALSGGTVVVGSAYGLVAVHRWDQATGSEAAKSEAAPTPLSFAKDAEAAGERGAAVSATHAREFGPTLAAAIASRKTELSLGFLPVQSALRDKIEGLRQRVVGLTEKNRQKPELERLDRDDYVLDLGEKARLLALRDEAISSLRSELELKMLAHQFLRNNIKLDAWDGMEQIGKTLFAFDGPLEVSNYALPRIPAERQDEIARVKQNRRIELSEARLRRQADERDGPAEKPSAPFAPDASHKESGEHGGAAAHDSGVRDEEDAEGPILYSPLQLLTTQRKRAQILLLEEQLRERKKTFNKLFEDNAAAKVDSIRKIQEKNQRIQKICGELKTTEVTEDPKLNVLETPEKLLEVRDEEVTVPRVFTAAELAAQAEERRLEEERLAAMARDNPHERGVIDMMKGRLEDQTDEDIWIDPPRPAFLEEVKKDDWTEEQTKQASEFAATMKELEDMRDKRKKALDAELRKLQEQILALRKGFDTQLQQLFEEKLRVEQRVCSDELYIMKLLKSIQEEEDILEEEGRLEELNGNLSVRVSGLEAHISAAQNLVDAITDEYNNVAAADRLMDKQFKQHRDFADCSAQVEALYKLFKRRPKGRKINEEAADIPPLDKQADCPDGVDDRAWDRLVALRDEKIESEALLRDQGQQLAEANSYLAERRAEQGALIKSIEENQSRITALCEERHHNSLNADVLLLLKQGQVEVSQVCDYDPDFTMAALVDRTFVDELNSATKTLAQAKVAHLTDLMEKRKGVRQLEWEHRYLDLENETLQEKIKEVQLFRVTKSAVSGPADPKKEVEALERSKAASRKAFERSLEEKRRTIKKLRSTIKKREEEVGGLDDKLSDLHSTVQERAQIHRVQVAVNGDGGAEEKLKKVQARRKLVGLVKAQAEEIDMLREEVERLRCKTFPAFPAVPPFGKSIPM